MLTRMKVPILTWVAVAAAFLCLLYGGVFLAHEVSAAQPREDAVVLDKDGCDVEVSWVDGMETAEKVTISFDGVVKNTITLDDIVGDQSDVLATVSASEGVSIRARLYVDGEIADEATTAITKCPTATPAPSVTPTSVPPTATATPVPPTSTPVVPTPVVIIQTVEVPKVVTVIQPPSTGSGGLLE